MIILPYQKYQIGQYIINCHDMTVSVEEKSICLPAKVFEFLKLLIAHPNRTVTKEQAINEIWLGNVEVGKRGAGNAIWHLRKTFTELSTEQVEVFKTVTKIGYQLLLEPVPIKTSGTSISETLKTRSLNSLHIFYITAATIVVVIFIFITLFNKNQNVERSQQTEKPLLKSTRITNFEGVEEQASISIDGRYMAFQWLRPNNNSKLFVRDLVNLNAPLRQISMTPEKEMTPAWSPDSKSLAYFRVANDGECSLLVTDLKTNNDLVLDTGCVASGYLRSIAWSPDGKKIAYPKKLHDSVAIVTYDFSSKKIEQFTFPKVGSKDLMMRWSKDSKQLVFVRSKELDAKLMLTNNMKQEQVLVDNEIKIIGLAWDKKNNHIYFNAVKDGSFAIQKYDVKTKTSEVFHIDKEIYSISINEAHSALYYSRHIGQEHITKRSLNDGRVINQLVSSSRDLYGQFVAKTGDILFLSNRSGAWEVWLKHDDVSTQLTYHQGHVGIPDVSPVDESFVIVMKRLGGGNYDLYQGKLPSGELEKLIDIDGDIRNPSYSQDGKRLYFSSNLNGKWGLTSYDFSTKKQIHITDDNVKYAIENDDGGIYYTKDDQSGIFYLSKDKQIQTVITTKLAREDWGNFFIQNQELFYLKRTKTNDILMRIDKSGVEHVVFTLPPTSIKAKKSIISAYDGTVIVSMLGINDADIYSIPLQ